MKTLVFKIEILSNLEKAWHALWNKENYTKWTKPFTEECYFPDLYILGQQIKF